MTYPNNANTYLPGTIQIPSTLEITAITNSFPMVCTVETNPLIASNVYRTGMNVILTIPYEYGMQQANNLNGTILDATETQITLDIDSRNFDTFLVPLSVTTPAQMSPNGSRNLQYIFNNTTQVAFQSFNDFGN